MSAAPPSPPRRLPLLTRAIRRLNQIQLKVFATDRSRPRSDPRRFPDLVTRTSPARGRTSEDTVGELKCR